MIGKLRIILIGNYLPDHQESMIRFAQSLDTGFKRSGIDSDIWWPIVFFGKYAKSTSYGLGKWLGYIDKFFVFPILIKIRLILNRHLKLDNVRFHICDHSNSLYIPYLPTLKTSITCHDVLAIRGGLGFTDAYCDISGFGAILQKSILKNLSKARVLATVSENTLKQLKEIAAPALYPRKWEAIHLSFNADFTRLPTDVAYGILAKDGISSSTPFILHVGSSLVRKNRKLLVDMVNVLGNNWFGNICYAGQMVDDELMQHAKDVSLNNRIISIVNPSHQTLLALYSTCEAFVFPSLSEGFGWPLIEAQKAGAPVLASNIEPMPEVSGGAALHADPHNPKSFANALLKLQEKGVRDDLIQRGYDNCKRFGEERVIAAYTNLLK